MDPETPSDPEQPMSEVVKQPAQRDPGADVEAPESRPKGHGVVIDGVAPAPSQEYRGVKIPRARIEVTSDQRSTTQSSYYKVQRVRQIVETTLFPDREGILHAVHPVQTWREEFWEDQPLDSYRREASGSRSHPDQRVYLHVWGDQEIQYEVCTEDPTRKLGLRTSYWSDRTVLKALEHGDNRELFERAKELIRDLETSRPFPTESGSSWTDVVASSGPSRLAVHVRLGDEQDPSKVNRDVLVAWVELGRLQWDLGPMRQFPTLTPVIMRNIRLEGVDLVVQTRDT